ncbi:MAG: rhodanese-like domain-containing protein [Bacteriovorax sp.]|jgi:rhodanese-related sulfurtransferase
MKSLFLVLISLLSFSVLAGTEPKAAYEMAKAGKAVIVDVREADEIKTGMIDGAKWFPLSKMKEDKNWKKDFEELTKGKTIFLHCRSGNRSGKAQDILGKDGIESENIGGYETLKAILPVIVPLVTKQ